jgi:NAD(P)-dependent dehydrogenase (short-subunit alcohol dehydrogenase family)
VKTVVITGVTGALGGALAEAYADRGWEVVGVSRQRDAKHDACTRMRCNAQETLADAQALLQDEPDVLILCAGQIESEVGERGLPLPETTSAIYAINAVFPSLVAVAAGEERRGRALDVVAVGSIADGSPSSFGPVYHASKIALHHFYAGVAPIARSANPLVRLRLYRPGVIRGPLSWAPALRLNERGRKVRARRCEGAPPAADVAERMIRWIESGAGVGSYDEPISFRALKLLFALSPGLYWKLQQVGWRKGSKFA